MRERPSHSIVPEAERGSNSRTFEPTKKWFSWRANSRLTSIGSFWKRTPYSPIHVPSRSPRFPTVSIPCRGGGIKRHPRLPRVSDGADGGISLIESVRGRGEDDLEAWG